MTLNELRDIVHANALDKGFYAAADRLMMAAGYAVGQGLCSSDIRRDLEHLFFAQRIALIQSEVSEALEADRKNRHANVSSMEAAIELRGFRSDDFEKYIKDSVEDELADTIIRLLDLCGAMGIDIAQHVEWKQSYNSTRPTLHGKEY